jgi:hypothetical protein
MRPVAVAPLIGLALACLAGACRADDVSLGGYAHDVNFSGKGVHEGGEELIGAWGGQRLGFLAFAGGPSPYVVGGLNLDHKTNFVAAGLRWKLNMTRNLYLSPGVGFAYNDAPTSRQEPGRIWSGSHATFEPEVALGWQATRRVAIEASWIHLSHAKLFSDRNPAINELGARLVYRFNMGDTGV